MVIRKALVALAAAGMVFGSTAAAAAPAFGARSASPVADAENTKGNSFMWIVGILILLGVIGVIAADGNEDLPASP
jgi:hypothetical protein